MKLRHLQPVLAGLLALGMALPAAAALPLTDSQGQTLPTLAPMLDKTVPGVVNIFTRVRVPIKQHPLLSDPYFRRFFDVPAPQERFAQSLGSGVIVDASKGYILTNHHVINQAVEISVNLSDGRSLTATLVGSDPETDIAVIKVEPDKLVALNLADSSKLRVGDFVVAVGNPFGLGQTVTSGIVSALGRTGLGIEGYEDFIQTDASINPGNSGGALVNLRGELVGINTAIKSTSGGSVGIGFAIPINMAREVMNQLLEHGQVRRGHLGAEAQDLTPELAKAFGLKSQKGGAVVTQVVPDSPAEKAGLKSGDVIIAVNGRSVTNAGDLRNKVGLMRVGQKVELKINRAGKSLLIKAKVREPRVTVRDGGELHSRLGGAILGDIVEGMQAHGKVQGVIVVKADGQAARAGLRSGDIILSANRQRVTTLQEIARAVKKEKPLLLNVQRGGGAFFILLQ